MTESIPTSVRPALSLLYVEQVLAEAGKQLAMVGLPVIAVQFLGADVGQVATISLINAIAALSGSLLLGRLSFTWAPWKIPVWGSAVWAAALTTLCVLAATGHMTLFVFVGIYAALNLVGSYYRIGVVGVVRNVADAETRLPLNARLNLYQSVVSVGMPSVAGLWIAWASPLWALGVTALGCVFSAIVFKLLLPGETASCQLSTEDQAVVAPDGKERQRQRPKIPLAAWFGVAIEGALAFSRAFVMAVLAVIALQHFGLGPQGLGFIFTAGGVGFLGGALVGRMTARPLRVRGSGVLSAFMAAVAGSGLIGPVLLDRGHLIGLSVFVAFSAAAALQFDLAVSTWRQGALSAEALGAVTGFADSAETAARLLAAAAAGAVGTLWGGNGICLVGAGIALVSAIAIIVTSKMMLPMASNP